MSDNPYNKYQPPKASSRPIALPHPTDFYSPEMMVVYNVFDATGKIVFQAPLYMVVSILQLHSSALERILATATMTTPCLLHFNGKPPFYPSTYHKVYDQMYLFRAPQLARDMVSSFPESL